jgi:Ankyrin repeats (3 copies)
VQPIKSIMTQVAAKIERPARGVSILWILALAVFVWLPALFLARTPPAGIIDAPVFQVEHRTVQPPTPPVDDEDEGKEHILKLMTELRGDGRATAQIARDNAMIRAAEGGDAAKVRRALAGGASVNAPYMDAVSFPCSGNSGYTALMLAAIERHADVVKLLIAHNSDPNIERKGRTALHFAAFRRDQEVIGLLVAAGAKGDPARIRLDWELIRAACKGYKMADWEGFPPYPGAPGDLDTALELKEVLKQGVDVNAVDPEGHSALMYAANLGLIDNVRVLLAAGADAEKKSKKGATALSVAEQENNYFRPAARGEVANLLRQHLTRQR